MAQPFDSDNADVLITLLRVLAQAAPSDDEVVLVDTLDGYLTALRCGPIFAYPLQAMDALLGDFWPAALDAQDATEIFMEALHARWEEIGAALEVERLRAEPEAMQLMPLITEFDADTQAELMSLGILKPDQIDQLPRHGQLWAEGFLRAVRDLDADWHRFPAEGDLAHELESMLVGVGAVTLADGAERDAYIADAYDAEDAVDQDVLLDDALFCVQDLRLFWQQPNARTLHS